MNLNGKSLVLGATQTTQWWYEPTTHTLESPVAGAHNVAQRLSVDQVRKWQEVTVFPYTGQPDSGVQPVDANSKWRIEYCWRGRHEA